MQRRAHPSPSIRLAPDVDGFVVNHSTVSKTGTQANAFVADSVGEFVGVVWETPNTGRRRRWHAHPRSVL